MRFASCVLVLVAGCFSGDATIGAVCRADGDCGADQTCVNEICGKCGDGASDPGEVCIAEAEAVELPVVAERVAIVDLDRDAFADLVVSGAGQVVPLLGGGFAAGPSVAVDEVVGLRGGDVDGDGLGDVVTLHASGFAVLFGDRVGGLVAGPEVMAEGEQALVDPTRGVLLASGSAATLHAVQADRSLVAGAEIDVGVPVLALLGPLSFDGDAVGDVAVVSADGEVVVLVGTAEGYAVVPAEGFGEAIVTVRMFDVAGESGADLVAITASGRLVVRESDGEGGFAAGTSIDADASGRALAPGDLNRDGETDVIVASREGLRLHLQRGGLLQPATPLPGAGAFDELVLTRIDADGQFDLLAAGGSEAVVLRGEP